VLPRVNRVLNRIFQSVIHYFSVYETLAAILESRA
jgi:hypothetical protein